MIKLKDENITGIAALLVHAAKIDENYTEKEKKIILSLIDSLAENNSKKEVFLKDAEILESNSNQLVSFTRIIKENSLEIKSQVIEQLWKIIISDNTVDQYESNLVRRICGLIYFPDKLSGEIKLKIQNIKK
jgi:uncharacterized tellurite resistance protein B-like protein